MKNLLFTLAFLCFLPNTSWGQTKFDSYSNKIDRFERVQPVTPPKNSDWKSKGEQTIDDQVKRETQKDRFEKSKTPDKPSLKGRGGGLTNTKVDRFEKEASEKLLGRYRSGGLTNPFDAKNIPAHTQKYAKMAQELATKFDNSPITKALLKRAGKIAARHAVAALPAATGIGAPVAVALEIGAVALDIYDIANDIKDAKKYYDENKDEIHRKSKDIADNIKKGFSKTEQEQINRNRQLQEGQNDDNNDKSIKIDLPQGFDFNNTVTALNQVLKMSKMNVDVPYQPIEQNQIWKHNIESTPVFLQLLDLIKDGKVDKNEMKQYKKLRQEIDAIRIKYNKGGKSNDDLLKKIDKQLDKDKEEDKDKKSKERQEENKQNENDKGFDKYKKKPDVWSEQWYKERPEIKWKTWDTPKSNY